MLVASSARRMCMRNCTADYIVFYAAYDLAPLCLNLCWNLT